MKKAPTLLYLVIFLLIIAALFHALGVTGVIKSWNWLRAFEVMPGTIYLVFKNVLLALGFLASAVAFTFRKRCSPALAAAFTLLSAAWFWVDRIVLNQSPLPFSRHVFAMVLTLLFVLILLLSYWSLEPFMNLSRAKISPGGDLDEKT